MRYILRDAFAICNNTVIIFTAHNNTILLLLILLHIVRTWDYNVFYSTYNSRLTPLNNEFCTAHLILYHIELSFLLQRRVVINEHYLCKYMNNNTFKKFVSFCFCFSFVIL